MAKIKLTGGHIGFMLIIEMAKIELTGGHMYRIKSATILEFMPAAILDLC